MDLAFDIVTGILVILAIVLLGVSIINGFKYLFAGNLEGSLEEFLMALILLEMYELLSLYLKEHHVSMRRVAELGIVAIIRKIVISTKDTEKADPLVLFAFALMILALGWIYTRLETIEKD
ncbi:hypothetical protein PFC_06290 [Pyrococcus furiosus COM1]|uniref:Phosphate-starvation-inducible E-like protein n=1 Tax=Pyrococcus furiosus COM1 TaxID=1185654 RepID=I6TXM3_9EURY|nr:hypothetical protein PFC_06290 [Pyrococcus furiosus COM1]